VVIGSTENGTGNEGVMRETVLSHIFLFVRDVTYMTNS
jgi:hypothetical protein